MRVHQVVVGARAGDAITASALGGRDALRTRGPSDVFGLHVDPSIAGEVRPLRDFPVDPVDLIVFHASIGEPAVQEFLLARREPLALVYHNVSPAEPYTRFDPAFAQLLAGGRAEIQALLPRVVLAMADSPYNARELAGLGFDDVRVLPLAVDVGRVARVAPEASTLNHLRAGIEGPVVLSVSQLLPHKRPDLLILAYHVLVTWLRPDAELVLVGAAVLPAYTASLQRLVSELNLPGVWFTGPVDEAQLAAFYRGADVFVSPSAHEGFGLPIVEAMAAGVPVIATGCAAVPETVAGAGLVLPCDAGPLLIAEAMDALLGSTELRAGFRRAGLARAAEMDPARAAAELLAQVESVVGTSP
ncbi:MAG: hexosyltransferase [Actinomycetia bacterium]|nr:hexosyltransferase [Actinomycetes bacterium]